MAAKKKNEVHEAEKEQTFTLDQLLASKRFSNRRDLLKAVLSKDKRYSISEAEKNIENFLKGKVK
jgi:hypothetical protein